VISNLDPLGGCDNDGLADFYAASGNFGLPPTSPFHPGCRIVSEAEIRDRIHRLLREKKEASAVQLQNALCMILLH
jgi:hypothetical protein